MAGAKEKDAWWQDFGQGVGASGLGTLYGIQELFKELSPEQQERLDSLVADAAESGWGTAGQIFGEAVQMAMPGGAVAKGLKLSGKAAKLSSKARMAMDAASGGLVAAAQSPEEGQTRLGNAGAEVLGSLAGSGIGEIAGKLLPNPMRGIARTDAAEEYKDLVGKYPTPGIASSGNVVPRLEELAAMASPAVRTARGNAAQQLKDVAQRQVQMYPSDILATGNEGFRKTLKQSKIAWNRIWDDTPMSLEKSGDIITNLMLDMRKVPESDMIYMNKYMEDLTDIISSDVISANHKHTLRTMRETLDKAVSLAEDAPPRVREAFANARKRLDDGLPAGKKEELALFHQKKPGLETLKKARARSAATPVEEGPPFSRMLQAGAEEAGDEAASVGDIALYNIGQLGLETVDRPSFGLTNSMVRKINPILPDVVDQEKLERGARLALGQTPIQKAGTKFSDSLLGEGLGLFKPRTGNVAAATTSQYRDESNAKKVKREQAERKKLDEKSAKIRARLQKEGWK